MAATKGNAIFLHCLRERGRETDGVMSRRSPRSASRDGYAQNAIMVFCANAPRP